MGPSVLVRRSLGVALAVLIVGMPIVYYRATYAHAKRLRVVAPGILYRSGWMTANGFRDALTRYRIRTVVNLQDEFPNPVLSARYLGGPTVREKELCENLTVRYVWLPPDLISRRQAAHDRPRAIEKFLAIMDDPKNYPVLIHCKAGLHRTGVMAAVYRMEYQGWSHVRAIAETKAHGFGDSACTTANDYIVQYILGYRRGLRRTADGQLSAVGTHPSLDPDG